MTETLPHYHHHSNSARQRGRIRPSFTKKRLFSITLSSIVLVYVLIAYHGMYYDPKARFHTKKSGHTAARVTQTSPAESGTGTDTNDGRTPKVTQLMSPVKNVAKDSVQPLTNNGKDDAKVSPIVSIMLDSVHASPNKKGEDNSGTHNTTQSISSVKEFARDSVFPTNNTGCKVDAKTRLGSASQRNKTNHGEERVSEDNKDGSSKAVQPISLTTKESAQPLVHTPKGDTKEPFPSSLPSPPRRSDVSDPRPYYILQYVLLLDLLFACCCCC